MSTLARYKLALAANILAIGLALWYLASLAIPASEATRLRNAILIDTVTTREVDWTPGRVPTTFKQESMAPTALYADVVHRLGVDAMGNDWEKALAIAGHLTQNAKDLGAIQADLDTAYRAIVDQGRGYCADFTQVFLGLAHAAGLFAREWGFSFDGFGGHGHAVVEVFDRQRGRWLWLDVYNNVHAVDFGTQEPLSADEFRAYTVGTRPDTVVRANGPGRLGYVENKKLLEYYRRGMSEWYLWGGNAVFSYDAHPLVRAGGSIAAPIGQLLAIVVGVHPRILIVPNEGNAVQRAGMAALRSTLIAIVGLLAVSVVIGIGLILRLRRFRTLGGGDAGVANVSVASRHPVR